MKQFFILIGLFWLAQANGQTRFVSVKNNVLTDTAGKPVHFEGVNLGGWLLWEGWIWGGGFTPESDIKKRIVQAVGQAEGADFFKRYYQNYITEKDICAISEMGFNSVRLPFNYRILDQEQFGASPGFAIIDSVIRWCKKWRLYVMLDMHAAPGGQNNAFISDPEKNKLWKSTENKNRYIAWWKEISLRYKNENTVAGYDLLNEPDFPKTAELLALYAECVQAIRSVGDHHMLTLEGNNYAHNFKDFTHVADSNTIYSFHFYPWFAENSKAKNLKKTLQGTEQLGPLWCGEWGEDNFQNLADIIQLVGDYGGHAFWTYKRTYENNNRHPLCEIKQPAAWKKLMNWVTWHVSKPGKQEAMVALEGFLNAIKFENCTLNKDVRKIILGTH